MRQAARSRSADALVAAGCHPVHRRHRRPGLRPGSAQGVDRLARRPRQVLTSRSTPVAERRSAAAPAGAGAARGAARAHGRAVLGAQGRRRLVDPEGRARTRRGPAGRGRPRVHRGAGLATARRPAASSWAPSRQRGGKQITVFAAGAPTSTPTHITPRHLRAGVAAAVGHAAAVPRDRPGGVVRRRTRRGASWSAARWSSSTACWRRPCRRPVHRPDGTGYRRPDVSPIWTRPGPRSGGRCGRHHRPQRADVPGPLAVRGARRRATPRTGVAARWPLGPRAARPAVAGGDATGRPAGRARSAGRVRPPASRSAASRACCAPRACGCPRCVGGPLLGAVAMAGD